MIGGFLYANLNDFIMKTSSKMKKFFCLIFLALTSFSTLAQLPVSDHYPYLPPAQVISQAQAISDSLESYITKWTQGLVNSNIPNHLIPQGITDSKNFYLIDPNTVSAAETWAVRYAKPINKDSLLAGIPDPKITYLFLGTAFAPFGSKLFIEGEFPHCRFFSIQITPPLNGKEYYSQRQFGTAEVSIADADIEPLPGHTNPFRIGSDRNATNRSYKMEFDLTTGDPVLLNDSAHIFPYRQQGNNLKGSMLVYQGPLGFKTLLGTSLPANQQGAWNLGAVWIRIYEPDDNVDALGGVPMPKVYFELPGGEKYFIGSDFSALQRRADTTSPNRVTVTQPNAVYGPAHGWIKSFGITRGILIGICKSNGWFYERDSINKIDLGWTGRGEFQTSPGKIEPHATTNNYASYMGRSITIPPGMVAVLTGKLPTYPSTRNGETSLTMAQVRYWSLIGYDADPFSPMPATTVNAISDDDVVIDSNRNYVIAYSRDTDKPINATSANGVSWVDWGTQSELGVIIRWVCVAPEWTFPLAPQENHLDWAHTDWAGSAYDSTLIGVNWYNGFMKCYQPRIHYMTKAEFEALGSNLNAEKIPVWVDSSYTNAGAAESQLGIVTTSSVLDTTSANKAINVNDGNMSSAWSSSWGDPNQWITIDMGSIKKISAVKLNWDWIFFAKDYTIKVSDNNSTWTTIATATNENGQVDIYKNLVNISGRYVKLDLTNYNVGYYRLGEFEVYTSDCDCEVPSAGIIQASPETSEFIIFPNPGNDVLNFKINVAGKSVIQIFDFTGRLILTEQYNTSNGKINIKNMPSGIYFIAIKADTEKFGVKKFIKIN